MAVSREPVIYKVECCYNDIIEVEEKALKMSGTMRTMLADLHGDQPPKADDEPIQMHQVPGPILRRVFEWCDRHKDDPEPSAPATIVHPDQIETELRALPEWDLNFLIGLLPPSTLYEVIRAANYLDIKRLLRHSTMMIGYLLHQCKSPEQIRRKLGIANDFTPEEEEQIRQENQWAEQALAPPPPPPPK